MMANLCLFTGQELNSQTRNEHAIPESMGGRIKSRRVCSSEFNNQSGSFCDTSLGQAYRLIQLKLAPLLPSFCQPPNATAISSDMLNGMVIEPGGVVGLSGNQVLERDDAGRPKKVIGPNEASLKKIAEQTGMCTEGNTKWVPVTGSNVTTTRLPILSGVFEVAALRSILLTFDCLFNSDESSFVRGNSLRKIRDLVRSSIESKNVDGILLRDHSLGIQLEKLHLYEELRDRFDIERTPFEHYMLIAGNQSQHCIDAVWVVYGFEPHGFRLSYEYAGESFCMGFVNPVLKGGSPSPAIELSPIDDLLCKPTKRRTFQSVPITEDEIADIVSEIEVVRSSAYNKSVLLLNTSKLAEPWLLERLKDSSKNQPPYSFVDRLLSRLRSIFPDCNEQDDFVSDTETTLSRCLEESGVTDLSKTMQDVLQERRTSVWVDAYRAAVLSITEKYGDPGGGYICDPEISNDAVTWQKLGIGKHE